WRDPLAVESSATAGLSVRYHHPIRFAVHCRVARSGVRTRQTLVIVDCEGCIQPVFDGRTAVVGDPSESVAVVALDPETCLPKRLDVFPDRRARDLEAGREVGTRNWTVGDGIENRTPCLLHAVGYGCRDIN